MSEQDRFDRAIRFFGIDGQKKLRQANVVVAGGGGLGSQVIQQLALLGVGAITVIDDEELSTTNKNRYVTAIYNDPVPTTKKTDIALRLITMIDPTIVVDGIDDTLLSEEAFEALKKADFIFGCFDADGPRFVLNDLATAYGKPYIDLASDIIDGAYGGRIITNWSGDGCLHCLDELDPLAVQNFLENGDDRKNREAIYGINLNLLDEAGPSVVSINGVVASLAVTEFMVACTGVRRPKKLINYNGALARITTRDSVAHTECPYCGQWGIKENADIERYLRYKILKKRTG